MKTFVLAALAILAIVLVAPRGAEANYSVAECKPDVYSADAGLVAYGSYSIWGRYACGGSGYGLKLETGADTGWTANGAWLAWRFSAPGGTHFATASALVHYGTDSGFGPATAPAWAPLDGGTGPDQWARPTQIEQSYFEVRLQCFWNPNCHSNWAYAWINDFQANVRDDVGPGITAGGALLDGGVVRGVQTLQATATDVGGGARSISVSVNGVYSRGVDFCAPNYGSQYTSLKPCPDSSGTRLLSIDTENDQGWTNGPNDVVICSTDVGGNVSSPCIRRTVQVDNSCPGSGGTAAADLDAGADVAGQLKSRAAVTSNQQPVIRGSLKDGAGSPVSGATVCVYQTIDLPDASREFVTAVTTQGNGRFATKLDAGPSRLVNL
ncbi:MAG: hypothetical protein ACRDK5_00490, partial [Solirubrobacterales bacterium]